jgi:spore coat polysaccharide biosynthesis protein SpsF
MNIIAEVAQGFEGNLRQAELLALGAIRAGADAIKYQLVYADELATPDYQYYNFFKSLEMDDHAWESIASLIKKHQKKLFFDIYGDKSYQLAKKLGASGVKISTTDFYNEDLIKKALNAFETVFISIGGIPIEEIDNLVRKIALYDNFILMYGFQAEPTNVEDNHLLRLAKLKDRYQHIYFGFMDHSIGYLEESFYLPIMVLNMGVTYIEKHITLDPLLKIEDHISALEPQKFKKFVCTIRKMQKALGNPELILTEKEKEYQNKAGKVVVAKRNLSPGDIIQEQDVELKRVSNGNSEKQITRLSHVLGKTINLPLEMNAVITKDMLLSNRKLVAALACRVKSSRLYAKPLQNLDIDKQRTILDYILSCLKEEACIEEIVLGISRGEENAVFIDYAKKNNLPYIIGDENDVLMRLIQCGVESKATDIFRITPESPYTYYEAVENAWIEHISGDYDATFLDEVPDGSGFEIFKLNALQFSHHNGDERHRSELCSLYIRENREIFNINQIDVSKKMKRTDLRLTVDYPEDLILCRSIYTHFKDRFPNIPLNEIILYLDENPYLKALVQKYVEDGLKNMYL